MIGTTLSHYRVLQLLGRGGMGEVYAAEDLKLRRRVALKVLPPEMAAEPERRRRFEREAQAVAALNHPGIVTIYAVEHENDTTFLIMELVEGRTLDHGVPKGGMPLADFLRIAIPLADAVNAAHERGILHRDLKPGNVMLTTDGRIKVLDFGLAKLAEGPTHTLLKMAPGSVTTSAGQIMGTLTYMAPEQAEGKPADHRADIFALGVVLYELLAGTRPFAGETSVSILTALLRDTPRPLSEVRHDLPPAIAPIIQRCLEKEPGDRYQSAADLRADLEQLRGSVPERWKRVAAPRWTFSAAAGVALLAGVAGWWGTRTPGAASGELVPFAGAATETAVLVTGRQVAILDFDNRTGDPAMSTFGRAMSEALAAALAAEGLPVVSAIDASAADGLTIAGAYMIEGENVRFDAQVRSASRSTIIRALEPVRSHRSSPMMAVDDTRRRVIAAILSILEASRPSASSSDAHESAPPQAPATTAPSTPVP